MGEESIRLRACMKEIEGVMKRYEAGGYIILADKDGGEYKFVNPSWSIMKGDLNKDNRAWLEHRVAENEKTEWTVNLFQVIESSGAKAFMMATRLMDVIRDNLEVTGGPTARE